ncbi:MAG TPA: trimethylamine methyltransferase family protein [Ilumatobacteraceae bacterium]
MAAPAPSWQLPDDAIDVVMSNAAVVLRRTGVAIVDDPETEQLLADAGLIDTDHRVRADIEQLLEIAGSAPRTFIQHARNPARSIEIGAGQPIFVPVYGPPNVRADDGIRRPAMMADYEALVRIAADAAGLATTGHMLCVPHDVLDAERDRAMVIAHLELSDKPLMGATTSGDTVRDVVALVDSYFDHGAAADCRLLHLANSIPPLTFTSRMLGVIRASAALGQATITTSYQLLGLTGPAAVLGALTQGLVENLVGIAITQLVRPGAPVIFGIYGTPFDMRSMLPRFGDPMSDAIQAGAVQLARRLNLPALGYGGMTSSKLDDAQAGLESATCTNAARRAGADVIMHAAGWLENGRTTSFSKFRREAAALATAVAAGSEREG